MGIAAQRGSRRAVSRRDPLLWGAVLGSVAVLLLGVIAALSHSEPRRAGSNGVQAVTGAIVPAGALVCQRGAILPADAVALQMPFTPVPGQLSPALGATLSHEGKVVGRGREEGGWSGEVATIPIRGPRRELADVEICISPADADVGMGVGVTPSTQQRAYIDGADAGGSVRIDYLRTGQESWWSFGATVVRRIAAAHGGWSPVIVAAVLAVSVLGAWLLALVVVRRTVLGSGDERRRGLPTVAWAVAALGILNALTWSVITPPFQVPDEIGHVAYAQTLAETGKPPIETPEAQYSPELLDTMGLAHFDETSHEDRAAIWTDTELERLRQLEESSPSRVGDRSAGLQNPEPPLYYALTAIPYKAAAAAPLLDRIALMRLVGVLLCGVTTLFVFLFVRECLPRTPWAWGVGGLVVAFIPMVGFMSGGVNPDALLFPVCAALFYCLARAFRRGLTTRLACALGVVLAIGLLGKINFYGLVPGMLLAVALAARGTSGGWDRRAGRSLGIVLLVGFAPYALMHMLDALLWDRANILWKDTSEARADRGGPLSQLGYLWQVYLPPLPGQRAEFPDYYIGYELWWKSIVGRFGQLRVNFAPWVYQLAVVISVVIAGMALRAAIVERDVLRRRRPELVGYAAMVGGLVLLIGLVALRGWTQSIDAITQGRYLFPFLALAAACLVLAVRSLGDRWGRALGVALVVLAIGWGLFGQLVTIDYFYG